MWNSLAREAKQENDILLSMAYEVRFSKSRTNLVLVHELFLWGTVSAEGAANLRRWTATGTRRCTATSWWPGADTFCLRLAPYSPWPNECGPKPGAYKYTHTHTYRLINTHNAFLRCLRWGTEVIANINNHQDKSLLYHKTMHCPKTSYSPLTPRPLF